MVLTSRYWQMVMLTSSGQRQVRDIAAVKSWYEDGLSDKGTHEWTDERDLQTHLWKLSCSDAASADALGISSASLAQLSLRCWLSHTIAGVCAQLAGQFGTHYGFTAADLWPLVLDDDGRLAPTYSSLAVKILEQYNPNQASLSTWANRMAKGHPEINRFCLERGLYRISDWAILNDTPVGRLGRSLPGLSKSALAEKTALLAAYHQVYRRDRITQRQTKGRASRCGDPTSEQLLEIQTVLKASSLASLAGNLKRDLSPEVVLGQLHDLADQLRAHRIAVRRGMPMTQSLDALENYQQEHAQYISTESEEAEISSQDDFLQRYRTYFLQGLDDAIKTVMLGTAEKYQTKKPSKGQHFLSALNLFHCQGLSMGAIAKQIGLNSQVQVTRLLNLKRFRTEVCAHWLNSVKQQVNVEVLKHISRDRLDQISQQLETILTEETDAVMAEAAAEAQVSKGRETKSTFARRLCNQLSEAQLSDSQLPDT